MQYNCKELHACRRIIGKNLQQLRLAQYMSLEQCSAQSQLGLIYIHNLERGKTSPTLDILFRLACSLNVSLEELFKDAGPQRTKDTATN